MSHFPDATPMAVRPWALALSTLAVLTFAGCGSDDNIEAVVPPPPLTGAGPQATPTDTVIAAAQKSIDGTASPAVAATGVPTDAQITLRQASIDGSTSAGLGNVNSNQAAMDASGSEQPFKSF